MNAPGAAPAGPTVAPPRWPATETAGALAASLLALGWVWICGCQFPDACWNEVRLLPAFLARHGIDVYATADNAVLHTWLYGPVPLWLWSPATLGGNVESALLLGAGVNAGLTLGALALFCALWPDPALTAPRRLFAFALATLLWPAHAFQFIGPDNVAIAGGLVGTLFLFRAAVKPSRTAVWLAALGTAAALGSKQLSLALVLAHVLWLGGAQGAGAAGRHLLRVLACGAALLLVALPQFGMRGLWFTGVVLPSALPWTAQWADRAAQVLPALLGQCVVALLALLLWNGRADTVGRAGLRLGLLCWLALLPLGVAAAFTLGGDVNSLHGGHYLLPIVLLVALAQPWARRRTAPLFGLLACLLVVLFRLPTQPTVTFKPVFTTPAAAREIHRQFGGRVWLPWNPLVAYFADGKFYHAEDGIFTRLVSGLPVGTPQVRLHLPAGVRAVATPPWHNWGIAEKIAPPGAHAETVDGWKITFWPPPVTPSATTK